MTALTTNTLRRLLAAGAISLTAVLTMAACNDTTADPTVESEEIGDEDMDEEMDDMGDESMDEDMDDMEDHDMEEMEEDEDDS